MRLNEVMRNRRPKSGQEFADETWLAVTDPRTNEETEIPVIRHFNFDNGDVGFGVGPGKSPYPSVWEFDYAEAGKDFTFMGKQYKAKQTLDLDTFTPYMDEYYASTVFDAPDDAGDYDEGY